MKSYEVYGDALTNKRGQSMVGILGAYLLRDLPHMTGWVGKGGGAAPPGTIDGAVHQLDAALPEPRAGFIDIGDANGHEHARSGA